MLTDAHCHPYDLIRVNPQAEEERIEAGVLAAASACLLEEFVYNESLPNILPYFGIHPQMPAVYKNNLKASHKGTENTEETIINLLKLAKEKRIAAIGECGFDLYNAEFKETEKIQEQLFIEQLEIALQYGLPVIIHARRAMHKIFENTEKLKKCKAVVFHSWPGTLEEASAIIRRGLNVYFSFGNTIKLNHKQVIKSCAHLPADRLLT
ncbi:MAG: TatD family hydrolase, partial [Treponema sp.]|nr:TatD family hydrolase [Treponema sp.]